MSNASRGLRLGKIQIPTGQTFLPHWGCSVLSPEGGDVVNISVQTALPSRYRGFGRVPVASPIISLLGQFRLNYFVLGVSFCCFFFFSAVAIRLIG